MPKLNTKPIRKRNGNMQAASGLHNKGKEFMRITRIMLVGIILILLGITAFAYQGVAMQALAEDQNIWRVPPLVGTAMLLAAGVVLVAAEGKKVWVKLGQRPKG